MRNDYTDYIMHSSRGEERKNHKYKAREWVKGKWQYIYDEKLGGKEKRNAEMSRVRYANAHTQTNLLQKNPWSNSTYDSNKKTKFANALENESIARDNNAIAERAYNKTVIGALDNAKKSVKDVGDKLFAKHNEKKDAKKTAEQHKAREEGMAERERQKTEANNWRAAETRQNDQFRKAKADIRDANAAKRETGYAKDAAAKTETERKQYLETRVNDIGKKRAEYENTLNEVVKAYTKEYIKALKGENNKLDDMSSTLQNASLLLSHTKALESVFQQNLKDASMYGNYNSNSYGDPLDNENKVNDYLKKLEKEYHKLMG